jgi:hypothetical protein
MKNPINMIELANNLPTRPRGKACIVLTHNFEDQKKWAAELAHQTKSENIDLLDLFSNKDNLKKRIATFLIPNLFDFLKSYKTDLLIVSGLEFLKATWASQPNSIEQFTSHVETWNGKPSLIFVMQYDKQIANREFRRYRQHIFVIDQKETLAL